MSIYFKDLWDFPGGLVVRTSPSDAGAAGSIPHWEAKIPHTLKPKKPKHETEATLCQIQ